MEISQQTLNPTTGTPEVQSKAATQIGSDFEVFLQMLTAQMKYQDPLNPVDSTDYATQLATFSGVEQAVLTNDLLKSLTTQMGTGGLIDMAGLVGKEVRSTADVYFEGEPITLMPSQTVASDSAELVVRDSSGIEVQRLAIRPADQSIEWAGVGPNGELMQTGTYRFEIVSKSNDEVVAQNQVEAYGKVTEVRLDNGKTTLLLAGGASIASDQVTALRDGDG